MKILITGANHAKVLKLIKAFSGNLMVLADYGDVPIMQTEKFKFASLGVVNRDSIAHLLLNFCITEAIDSIIPLHHFEADAVAKASILFNEYGIEVLLPPAEKLSNYQLDKQDTNNHLAVFIKGECVFSTDEKKISKQLEEVNGVFVVDESENLSLFTI